MKHAAFLVLGASLIAASCGPQQPSANAAGPSDSIRSTGHGPCSGETVNQVVAEAVRSEIERVSASTYRLDGRHQTTPAIRPHVKSIALDDSILTGEGDGGDLKDCTTTLRVTVLFEPIPGVKPNDVIKRSREPRAWAARGLPLTNYPEIAQALPSLAAPCGDGPADPRGIDPYTACTFNVVDHVEYDLQPVEKTYVFQNRPYQVGTSDQGG